MRSIKGKFKIAIILLAFLGGTQSYAGGLNIPEGSDGGKICEVTTLSDQNVVGSLRRAMVHGYNINDSELPSFCTEKIIFKVAGTINLKSPLLLDNPAANGFTLEKDPAISGNVLLDASGVGDGNCGIVIDSDKVTIKGIAIRNAPEGGICIKSGSNNNTIQDVTVSDSKHGVVIEGNSRDNVIKESKFFNNTGFGVKMADPAGNLVSHNALYLNGAGAIDSSAVNLQPVLSPPAAADGTGNLWTIFGTLPGNVSHVEIYRGRPRTGVGDPDSNYIDDVLEVSTGTFQIQIPAVISEEIFAIGVAADGTTSPASTAVTLSLNAGTAGGSVNGPRPCQIGQVFPPTMDFDQDGIPDYLEDKNKDCQVDLSDETDPANSDTDGDGIPDGKEDRNKNGEVDAEESDPKTANSDQDSIPDGIEDRNQNGVKDFDESAAYLTDTDGDGLRDDQEDLNKNGVWDEGSETKAYDQHTDFDGLTDGEELGPDGIQDPFRDTDPKNPDTDGDGVDDGSDPCPNIPYVTCKSPCIPGIQPDPEADDDGDGLPNFIEDRDNSCGQGLAKKGDPDPGESNPYIKDTDGDGRNDGVDLCPNNPDLSCDGVCDPELINPYTDSDLDGIPNDQEDLDGNCFVDSNESDPFNPDSDGDNVNDGEDICPLDPNPLCSAPCLVGVAKPEDQDSDGDGISDNDEDIDLSCGQNGNETDFRKRDTDADGLNDNVDPCPNNPSTSCQKECVKGEFIAPGRDSDNDGIEDVLEDTNKNCIFEIGETDAYSIDSDADNLPDGVEDANRNGVFDEGETDPRNPDTDGDGILDGVEDRNFNGRKDFGECDAKNPDTDGDGILDFNEDLNLNGIFDAGETNCDRADTDQDGLSDGVEDANANGFVDAGETDPRNPDTDGDGANDGQEVQNGTNPINASQSDFNHAIGQGCSLGAFPTTVWGGFPMMGLALLAMAGFLRFGKKK